MKYSGAEQETTICISRIDDVATVYSCDSVMMAKLQKLGEAFPDVYRKTWTDGNLSDDGSPLGVRYEVPKKLIRFAKPASEARIEAGKRLAARQNRV